jgi:hypothetical protein
MKKSKFVNLVIITAALASCNKPQEQKGTKAYMRSDTTAAYSKARFGDHSSGSNALLWYLAFRPYGTWHSNGTYTRQGYYSSGIHESSNIGKNTSKNSALPSRGGFGSRGKGYSVSS